MCVEVDITKPLLSKFKLRRRIRRIEYEGIHLICFNCGVYGHRDDQCRINGEDGEGLALENQSEEADTGNDGAARKETSNSHDSGDLLQIRPEISESYGSWMLAPRRFGRRN